MEQLLYYVFLIKSAAAFSEISFAAFSYLHKSFLSEERILPIKTKLGRQSLKANFNSNAARPT